jgi:hypothetical protein
MDGAGHAAARQELGVRSIDHGVEALLPGDVTDGHLDGHS